MMMMMIPTYQQSKTHCCWCSIDQWNGWWRMQTAVWITTKIRTSSNSTTCTATKRPLVVSQPSHTYHQRNRHTILVDWRYCAAEKISARASTLFGSFSSANYVAIFSYAAYVSTLPFKLSRTQSVRRRSAGSFISVLAKFTLRTITNSKTAKAYWSKFLEEKINLTLPLQQQIFYQWSLIIIPFTRQWVS